MNPPQAQKPKTSSLAIAALLCGAFLPFPVFVQSLCIIAIRRINASDGALVGKWMAEAGLVLSILWTLALAFISCTDIVTLRHFT